MILAVSCDDFAFILRILGYLFKLLQWFIPIILIAFITYDVLKAIASGKEEKAKESINRAFKRFLYALIIFFIPILVRLLFRTINRFNVRGYGGSDNSAVTWSYCFSEYFK